MASKTNQKAPADGQNFTDRDTVHFETLMNSFDVNTGVHAERQDENKESPRMAVPDEFPYTGSDILEFQKLMASSNAPGNMRNTGPLSSGKVSNNTSYTEDDNHFFDALGSFDWRAGPNAGTTSSANPPKRQAPTPDTVKYSRQDLEIFARLMPGAAGSREYATSKPDAAPIHIDRDVGHIRIVDYDKQRLADSKRKNRPHIDMKIHYFD